MTKKGLLNADGCPSKLYHQVLCAFADQVWKWVQGGNTKLPMSGNAKYQMTNVWLLESLCPNGNRLASSQQVSLGLEIENVNQTFIFKVYLLRYYLIVPDRSTMGMWQTRTIKEKILQIVKFSCLKRRTLTMAQLL